MTQCDPSNLTKQNTSCWSSTVKVYMLNSMHRKQRHSCHDKEQRIITLITSLMSGFITAPVTCKTPVNIFLNNVSLCLHLKEVSAQNSITLVWGNSHRATPVSTGTTLEHFTFITIYSWKLASGSVKWWEENKQTAKAILSLLKEESGRQCGLLLESNTRLQSQDSWQSGYSQHLIESWRLTKSVEGNSCLHRNKRTM